MRSARVRAALAAIVLAVAPGTAQAPGTGAAPVEAPALAGHDLDGLLGGGRDRPLAAALPAFRPVMGYTPAAAPLAGSALPRWVKPSGACSSPLGGTPFGFEAVCKAHDFGYDLLRFADRTGEPAGPGARRALDDRFDRDLHEHCAATSRGLARTACDGAAAVYAGAVRLGSWAHGYGTP